MRRATLLRAALGIARRDGLERLTHASVAQACGCHRRTVYRWAGNRAGLRRKVLETGAEDLLNAALALRLPVGETAERPLVIQAVGRSKPQRKTT